MRKMHVIAAAAALTVLAPGSATAQGGTPGSGVGNSNVDLSLGNTEQNQQQERRFPWGLLGLLGLAGLLPRKKHNTGQRHTDR